MKKKTVVSLVLSAVCACLLSSCSLVERASGFLISRVNKKDKEFYETERTGFCDLSKIKTPVNDAATALEVIQDLKSLTAEEAEASFKLRKSLNDSEHQFYRFGQQYKGIPVYGAGAVVKAKANGEAQAVNDFTFEMDDIDTEPEISKNRASKAVKNYYRIKYVDPLLDIELAPFDENNLVIYPEGPEGSVRLAYKIFAAGNDFFDTVFLDAHTGDVIKVTSNIKYDYELPENGEIRTVAHQGQRQQQTFDVYYSEPEYYMADPSRMIELYCIGSEKFGWNWLLSNDLEINTDEIIDITWNQNAGLSGHAQEIDAMANTEKAVDAFRNMGYRFGQDASPRILVYTNLAIQNGTGLTAFLQEPERYRYDNAYGGATDDRVNVVIGFGKALQSEVTTAADLDVAAHELTHCIVGLEAGDMHTQEAKAVNEGLADIFGELAEFYITGSMDWVNGTYRARNIISPDTEAGEMISYADFTDDTEEHNGSTIISHTAFLMWAGIDAMLPYEPLSEDELASLWLQSLRIMPENCSFYELRNAVVNTAKDMFEDDPVNFTWGKYCCVAEAFNLAGLDSFTTSKDLLIRVDSEGEQASYDKYSLSIVNIQSAEEKILSGSDVSHVVFEETGKYQITIIDSKDNNNSKVLYCTVSDSVGPSVLRVPMIFSGSEPGENSNEAFNRKVLAEYRTMLLDGSWNGSGVPAASFCLLDIDQNGVYELAVESSYGWENAGSDSAEWDGIEGSILYYNDNDRLEKLEYGDLDSLDSADYQNGRVLFTRVRGKNIATVAEFSQKEGFRELESWFPPYLDEKTLEEYSETYLSGMNTVVFVEANEANINKYLGGDGQPTSGEGYLSAPRNIIWQNDKTESDPDGYGAAGLMASWDPVPFAEGYEYEFSMVGEYIHGMKEGNTETEHESIFFQDHENVLLEVRAYRKAPDGETVYGPWATDLLKEEEVIRIQTENRDEYDYSESEERRTYDELFDKLKSGAVDAVILDDLDIRRFLGKRPDFVIGGDYPYDTTYVNIAFPKNSTLVPHINEILREAKENGNLESLITKGIDIAINYEQNA